MTENLEEGVNYTGKIETKKEVVEEKPTRKRTKKSKEDELDG